MLPEATSCLDGGPGNFPERRKLPETPSFFVRRSGRKKRVREASERSETPKSGSGRLGTPQLAAGAPIAWRMRRICAGSYRYHPFRAGPRLVDGMRQPNPSSRKSRRGEQASGLRSDDGDRKESPRAHSLKVVVPLGAVEAAGLLAAVLESGVPIRRGRDRSGPASPEAPCRRARPDGRDRLGFRRGIPACAYGWT